MGLGEVLLISSARITLLMIFPLLYSNSPVFWLNIVNPVMSEGRISGVNWILLKDKPTDFAIVFAMVVFPIPGTSSMRT